jgi:8-oxo-dGTP pyrophosphatase MutT (NUDIX family)
MSTTSRRPGVADRVKRWGYRIALALLQVWWSIARPRTRGMRCVVMRGPDVLLVKHTYGDQTSWVLPGGRMKRGERPVQTAQREMEEELGLTLRRPRVVHRFPEREGGRRETVYCVLGQADSPVPDLNLAELRDAAWFPLAALPPEADARTRRIAGAARRHLGAA